MEKKRDNMFIVAIVGIVAIVALFLGSGTTTVTPVAPTRAASAELGTSDSLEYCKNLFQECRNNNVDVDVCISRVNADSNCKEYSPDKNIGGLAIGDEEESLDREGVKWCCMWCGRGDAACAYRCCR